MKKLITQIKPNTSPVEWDGRPDNVCQKCGYHTCCCQVQNAFLAKSLRLVKPVVLAMVLSVQFATAQITIGCQTESDSTIHAICGTTNPENGYYADEYGQIWDVWRRWGVVYKQADGSYTKMSCGGYCARRVDLSPVRKIPTKLTAVKSTGKYEGA